MNMRHKPDIHGGDGIMKLEHVGFSTMYDKRVRELSGSSEMKRCELILTDLCTFRCPYYHGIREECRGNIPMEKARRIIDIWTENGLENLRFSGGEPTIWPGLPEIVGYSKEKGSWNKVVNNIREISRRAKVSIGIAGTCFLRAMKERNTDCLAAA